MATIGTKALEKVIDQTPGLTVGERKAAKATLAALRDDYNQRHEQPDPPDPEPIGQSIFDKPGWFAVRYDKLPQPSELAAAGVKWVAAILSHGIDRNGAHSMDTDDRENQAWLASNKPLAYQQAGIKVGGWAWQQGFAPEAEARIAVTYTDIWHLDLWIANGEEVWKGNDQPARYAACLELEGGRRVPVAWSVLGAASGQNVYPFDYASFLSRGWWLLPQAYPQQAPEYKLSSCIDHAVRANISLTRIAPTIANYRPQTAQAFQPSMQDWQNELREAKARGVRGFSVWSHDFSVAQVGELVRAVA